MSQKSYRVNKGTNPDVDSYSSFWDNDKLSKTQLSAILSEHRVTDVYCCGLAYDICVGEFDKTTASLFAILIYLRWVS